VHAKCCCDLHVECFGSCMVSTIGVGAGKRLGVQRFLPEFSQTCLKRFRRLCLQIFSLKDHEDLFLGWPPKKVFMCFSANVGRNFMKSNNVGRHFCPDFQRFFPDFHAFCPDFQYIKTFRDVLATCILHHWLAQNFRHSSTRVWLHVHWRSGVSSA